MRLQKNCHGCGHSFKSFGMTQEEGVVHNGKTFCNDDCQMEAEVDALDNAAHMDECGLNPDGSEW